MAPHDRLATAAVMAPARSEARNAAVSASGPGMGPDELEQIFQPFYRGSAVNVLPGFGLGLPLVKRIINLQKGSIHVSSDIKKGTTFLVVLPAAFEKTNSQQ